MSSGLTVKWIILNYVTLQSIKQQSCLSLYCDGHSSEQNLGESNEADL